MDSATALKEIDAVLASAAERWNRHDTATYAAHWMEDATFVNVVGMHREGRKRIQAEFDYLHAGRFKDSTFVILKRTVRFLKPDVAAVNVWWEMQNDPGAPGHPVENGVRRGVFTHVMLLTPDGWRFAASQNTDILPIPDFLQPA